METDVVIFEENLIIDKYEIVVSIKCENIIKYVDSFYAVNKGWKERIVIVQGKNKLTIVKHKKQHNEFFLENNTVLPEADRKRLRLSNKFADEIPSFQNKANRPRPRGMLRCQRRKSLRFYAGF